MSCLRGLQPHLRGNPSFRSMWPVVSIERRGLRAPVLFQMKFIYSSSTEKNCRSLHILLLYPRPVWEGLVPAEPCAPAVKGSPAASFSLEKGVAFSSHQKPPCEALALALSSPNQYSCTEGSTSFLRATVIQQEGTIPWVFTERFCWN